MEEKSKRRYKVYSAEFKMFEERISSSELVSFIRNYNLTETGQGEYINSSSNSEVLQEVKNRYALTKMDNLQLSQKEVLNIINAKLFFN